MQYTVILKNRSYDLPTKTIKIAELLDETANVDNIKGLSIKERYQRVYESVKTLIGKENAKEVFEGEDINKIDLSEVTIAFRSIFDAYNKPLEDYEQKKRTAMFNELNISEMSKLVDMAKVAKEMTNA